MRDFSYYLSDEIPVDNVEFVNSTSSYLNDLLNIDNIYIVNDRTIVSH